MQDSNPRGLFTRQVLESNPRPSRDKRAALTIVLSAQKYPWRESNSHFQLRKLALYPLSYRGLCAPLAGLEPATSGPGNRHTIHCATRALGRKDSHLRRQLWRPPLNQLSYIRIEPVASLELATFSLDDCRATSYTSPPS